MSQYNQQFKWRTLIKYTLRTFGQMLFFKLDQKEQNIFRCLRLKKKDSKYLNNFLYLVSK